MKIWVVYDSAYGNTERVAQAIGEALASDGDVDVLRAGEANPAQVAGMGLLVVGSPTQKFRPTGATSRFLKGIPRKSLEGIRVAAFDTRLDKDEIEGTPVLAFLVRVFGYAAKPIADRLVKKGGALVLPPEGFIVEGTEGPLVEGELQRAAEWARQIVDTG